MINQKIFAFIVILLNNIFALSCTQKNIDIKNEARSDTLKNTEIKKDTQMARYSLEKNPGDTVHVSKKSEITDEETAIKVAEKAWLAVYGEDIYRKKPFFAELKHGIWIVQGTSPTEKGGVPYAEIRKRDGKILKIEHGK